MTQCHNNSRMEHFRSVLFTYEMTQWCEYKKRGFDDVFKQETMISTRAALVEYNIKAASDYLYHSMPLYILLRIVLTKNDDFRRIRLLGIYDPIRIQTLPAPYTIAKRISSYLNTIYI